MGVRREIALGWQQLRSQGRLAGDTLLAHLSPAQSETIGLIGTIPVDIDHELAQLDPTGHRALSQAFRRDTSAMTVAADRLYERDRYVRCPPGGQPSGASCSGGDLC